MFAIDDEEANVLIHDAVRPFLTKRIITDCIYALKEYKAVNVAIESSDTIICVDDNNIIKSVPDRKYLMRCQTPQCFDLKTIKKAHYIAVKDNFNSATDDCSLVLRYNLAPVCVVKGSEKNIKITYHDDIAFAELFIK